MLEITRSCGCCYTMHLPESFRGLCDYKKVGKFNLIGIILITTELFTVSLVSLKATEYVNAGLIFTENGISQVLL